MTSTRSCLCVLVACATLALSPSAIAQTVQAPAAAAPAPPPPFPNRANELMPSWLRLRAELRERVEGFSNLNFTEGRDDAYALTRLRFNAAVTATPAVSFLVQVQDARQGDKEVGPTGVPFVGTFDLRMAYGDFGRPQGRLSARFGRQELAYGEQRLVGHVSWLNTARTFDGAKVTFRSKALNLDMFGASVVRIMDDEFDKSGNGSAFFGAYATAPTLVAKASVEPYVYWRRDINLKTEVGGIGNLHQTTIGTRWAGKLPHLVDYGLEMVGQTGSVGSDSLGAWAGHWQASKTFPGAPAVRLTSEFNRASGDKEPLDGSRGTFDNLYPTPHDKYGLTDQVGWKNIRHVRGGVDFFVMPKLSLVANYHSWWVVERKDAVYTAGGAVLARVPAGAADSHVGQELDLQLSRPLIPQLLVAGGFSHIFPGGFLKEATPGKSYNYAYVMATYVFLADK